MRIVILTSKLHAPSEYALNRLLRDDLNIVGVVVSDISPLNKSYWKYIEYGVRKSGIFYGALIGLIAYFHIFGLMLASILFFWRRRKWLTLTELKDKYNLNYYLTDDINSEQSIAMLASWEPDIIVSICFDQILTKPVIELPKVAALNVHPGMLPGYRGVWPQFWKLYKNEKTSGVTIHYINEKIDEGDILNQITFPITKTDSKFSLALKAAYHGTKGLVHTIAKLKTKRISIKPKTGVSRYRSLPKKKHFDKFFKRGKSLVSFFKDLLQVIRLSKNLDDIED